MRKLAWYTLGIAGFCILYFISDLFQGPADAMLDMICIALYAPVVYFAIKYLRKE